MLREEVEVCPHCMGENILLYNVEENGYEVSCNHCGEKIMLCDACLYSKDNKERYYDWDEKTGCFRNRKETSL